MHGPLNVKKPPGIFTHTPYMHHIMPPTSSHISPASHHAVPPSSGPYLHLSAHCSVYTVHHWQTRFLRTARKSRLSSKWTGTGNHQSASWIQVVPKIQHTINMTVPPNFHISQFLPKTYEVQWVSNPSSSIHQILLLLVEHTASKKSFQAWRSPAIPMSLFHDLLVLPISSSIVLCHILFSLPLLLYPWGFQSNAVFSIAPVSLRNVCPIQFHFLLFIWFFIDF